MLFAQGVLGGMAPRTAPFRLGEDTLLQAHAVPRDADSAAPASTASAVSSEPPASSALSVPTSPSASVSRREARREARREVRAAREQARRNAAFNALSQQEKDSLFSAQVDSLIALKSDSLEMRADSLATDSLAADTMRRDTVKKPRPAGAFLDDPISGKNTDSLVYDVRNKLVYIYNQGDVTYQNSNLKADFMRIDMNSKLVHAYGKPDSLDGKPIVTKPEFSDGSASYQMDTITYNLDSKKAKIKGVATQQGDGFLESPAVGSPAESLELSLALPAPVADGDVTIRTPAVLACGMLSVDDAFFAGTIDPSLLLACTELVIGAHIVPTFIVLQGMLWNQTVAKKAIFQVVKYPEECMGYSTDFLLSSRPQVRFLPGAPQQNQWDTGKNRYPIFLASRPFCDQEVTRLCQ